MITITERIPQIGDEALCWLSEEVLQGPQFLIEVEVHRTSRRRLPSALTVYLHVLLPFLNFATLESAPSPSAVLAGWEEEEEVEEVML